MKDRMKVMARTHKKRTSIKYAVLLLTAVFCIPLGTLLTRAALENDNSTQVRSVHVQDSEIEVSTLIVGSHLIHIQGLTETLYALALDSANEFSQDKLYYKSELANGQWFEITDAASIADITTEGTLVSAAEIGTLEFTHKTDAAGVTTDLRTGEQVSVFDIHSPYNLEAMEELEPLKLQYEMLLAKPEENRTDSDERYIEMIRALFAEDVRTQECIEADEHLDGLERYKADLTAREASGTWIEQTGAVAEAVDALRRTFVFYRLDALLDTLLNNAQGLILPPQPETEDGGDGENGPSADAGEGGGDEGAAGEGGGDEGAAGEDGTEGDGDTEGEEQPEPQVDSSLVVNSDVVAAVGESIANVQSSLSAYEAKLLTEGTTVIGKARYDAANELIVSAGVNDYAGCDTIIAQLCAYSNIIDEKVVDKETELSVLDTRLVPKTRENFEQALGGGASPDYTAAIAGGAQASAGVRYLKEQQNAANAARIDYQTMMNARWKRVENSEAVSEALTLLDGMAGLYASVQADDAADYLREVADEHKAWLLERYAALNAQGSADSKMDELKAEKERLQEQYRDALDGNDLSAAALLEARLAAVQADIDALEQDYLSILNSENSSESDRAKAMAGLGDGTAASALENLKDSLLSSLRGASEGSDLERLLSELENMLAAMRELAKQSPRAAAGAMKEISDALAGATGLDGSDASKLMAQADEIAQEAAQAEENGAGATMSAQTVRDLLDAAMRELFGTGYEDASHAQKAQALLALEWFGEQMRNEKIAALAGAMAQEQQAAGSSYLYRKYTGDAGNYLSVRAVGSILGYRTIFDSVHVVETLNNGMEYYTFTNGRRTYETDRQTKMMEHAACLQERGLYLAAADGKALFSLDAESIETAALAVAYTEDMRSGALALLEALKKG